MVINFSDAAAKIWAVADLLRGEFKQSQYGRIILPFTLLRRLECVLEPTKAQVLQAAKKYEAQDMGDAADKLLKRESGRQFYNTSPMTLATLGETQIFDNLDAYIKAFSPDAREIFEHFHFTDYLDQLDAANLLFLVVQRFANWDLSPEAISNYEMGLIFEELIRRFAESSNETAGEHFTPRDIVHLATNLAFMDDDDTLSQSGVVRSLYDPTAGTGGFLSEGTHLMGEMNPDAVIRVFGQELNPESYAICKGDMLIKAQDIANIKLGNTLSDDQLPRQEFDYMLSNPPFGVDWKKIEKTVKDEHKLKGYEGRFGPGLPRVSDGSLLFLLHLVSKMRDPKDGGSRIAIILNGSPLFTGGAGSGESEIRRYLLERDLLEAIVALPTDLFFNTGIATYIWVLSNRKAPERKGKVQLINATGLFAPMRRSLGSKRRYIDRDQIATIVDQYGQFEETDICKVFDVEDFGYRRITVERPLQLAFHPQDETRRAALTADKAWAKWPDALQTDTLAALDSLAEKYLSRSAFKKALKKAGVSLSAVQFKLLQKHLGEHDPEAEVCTVKGKPEPDPSLRDYENVPLKEDVQTYFEREVLPHVPDAWIDADKRDAKDGRVGIVGYEIPFNRHFYEYTPPRPLEEIDADLDRVSKEIMDLLGEVHV
ncbi:SAM-dependent DNA methyltransferase [Oceanidesulfovibrio indonesiensis]|uniref:site-specific DNA-methyltransferase (adenine-specific) n=1 Tax=Oceanidesulfovibrio indonesiensis TaxID=54767 RepID=A0A7M3ME69_9BACT|nr:class I SAM-dependent DNA methyltransferase [Oceanidesulfovibrio indonesiensis]TVM17095.1 SAM-dependent DNA methyltransferase [Oceanidesulfovibrio indonesiensis]